MSQVEGAFSVEWIYLEADTVRTCKLKVYNTLDQRVRILLNCEVESGK